MKKVIWVAAAALIDESGKILVARRPPGRSMAGLWEFPGGKIDEGETPEAALVRELEEELGIAVELPHLSVLTFVSHEYEEYHVVMLCYRVRAWSGSPASKENQEMKWVHKSELKHLSMPEADIPIVRILEL